MNEHAKQKDTSNPPRRTHPAVRSAIRLSEARPSYHMMSSPDLETGLARLIRYNGIVSGASTISFEPAKGGKWTRVELFGNGSPIPRQRYDYMALIMLTFCRWMLGRPIKRLAVTFMHPEPISLAAYDKAFGPSGLSAWRKR